MIFIKNDTKNVELARKNAKKRPCEKTSCKNVKERQGRPGPARPCQSPPGASRPARSPRSPRPGITESAGEGCAGLGISTFRRVRGPPQCKGKCDCNQALKFGAMKFVFAFELKNH